MAGSYIVNVPKLKGRENYDEWAFAAENFMMLDGVDIHKLELSDATNSIEEKKAKAKLVMTIDSSIYVHIKNEQTVQGVWKRLKSLYDDSGFTRRISLLRQLISIRLEGCESMGAYVTQMVDTAQKLKGTGFQITDEWIGSLLLAGLTDRFAPMIMAIEHSGLSISTDVIKSKLLDMSSEVGSSETNSAFLSKGWQHRYKNNNGQTTDNKSKTKMSSPSSSTSVKTIRCYKCKQLGHYRNKCPNDTPNKRESNAFSAIFMNGSFKKSDWYVDSGASSHMTTDKSCLRNVSLSHKVKEIVVANKEKKKPVVCSGNTMITTVVNDSEFDIPVNDVLFVPNLSTNLLSVSQMIRNGNKVIFEQEVCYIRNRQNVLVGKANLVNGVYKLNTRSEYLFACSATNTTSEIWHRRLGHIKEFKVLVETQTGRNLKVLRTDNGGEFCSLEFSNYLKKNGIVHQKTNPYTPEQNGLCERMNRTVVERARCLLFEANLDKKFWAEAVNTAVYLRNRILASGLQKTPYELWSGKKPDLSHVRIFGSRVMVHVPKANRTKWDRKAEAHILIGYSENTKGYRLYNPKTKGVTTSRDVVIMEEIKNSDMTQAVVEEKETVQSEKKVEHLTGENDSSCDPMESTYMTDDITYVPDDTTSTSSSDEFCDSNSNYKESENLQTAISNMKRTRKPPERYGFNNLCVSDQLDLSAEDITYKEATEGPEKEKWEMAMRDELQAFEDNQAWEIVNKNEAGTVVQCRWVFKKKLESDESIRYRARLVAKGFTQQHGVDYKETYAPVLRYSTLRLLFALSARFNFSMTHLDVVTAFLNGSLIENVYMQPPPSFNCPSDCVLKLKKAIYGLKQSARAWNEKLNDCLIEMGYVKSKSEPCLYSKKSKEGQTIIAIFVDDLFIFSDSKGMVEVLKNKLALKFKIKDLGQL